MPRTTGEHGATESGAVIRFAVGPCALGTALVAQSDRGLCAILLGDDAETLEHDLARRFPRATLVASNAELEPLTARVVALVDDPCAEFDLPLDIGGTAFQQRVWNALREIPPGETASYKTIAERIGAPSSTRAVASACGANSLAIVVPCHRVVRTDGALSGYRWGTDRKRALLDRERRCSTSEA